MKAPTATGPPLLWHGELVTLKLHVHEKDHRHSSVLGQNPHHARLNAAFVMCYNRKLDIELLFDVLSLMFAVLTVINPKASMYPLQFP